MRRFSTTLLLAAALGVGVHYSALAGNDPAADERPAAGGPQDGTAGTRRPVDAGAGWGIARPDAAPDDAPPEVPPDAPAESEGWWLEAPPR